MAGNSYLTLRAPIEIDYSATTSAGFSMSKATSKVKVGSKDWILIRGLFTKAGVPAFAFPGPGPGYLGISDGWIW